MKHDAYGIRQKWQQHLQAEADAAEAASTDRSGDCGTVAHRLQQRLRQEVAPSVRRLAPQLFSPPKAKRDAPLHRGTRNSFTIFEKNLTQTQAYGTMNKQADKIDSASPCLFAVEGASALMKSFSDISAPPSLDASLDDLSYSLETTDSLSALPPAPAAASPYMSASVEPRLESARMSAAFSPMEFVQSDPQPLPDTEFSNNVKTLIRLVSDLPDGVTKQTGAQIIRLTMEAMGIQMQEVLGEAQTAQNDMLEKVRTNIKKIEELKAIQRKLEGDIKIFQGKANELSEIIDLFILSSQSSN